MNNNIKILVATHKPIILPSNHIYIPLHVGKSLSTLSLPIQGDNQGINISDKNLQFCELTAIYWAHHNLDDFDFIGLYHYRRFLSFDKVNLIESLVLKSKYFFTKYFINVFGKHHNYTYWPRIYAQNYDSVTSELYVKKLNECIENYNLITLKPIKFSSLNVKVFWSLAISRIIFDIVDEIIKTNFTHYWEAFKAQVDSDKIYPCNIFICRKDLFNDYYEFIFGILFKLEVELSDKKINPLPRTMGYLAEVLTSTYIMYLKKKGVKIKELNVIEFYI